MIRNKQLFRHDPENGVYGDCHRTAMSCLLDLTPEQCPHFIGEYERLKLLNLHHDYDHWANQETWLNTLGYTSVDICFDGGADSLEAVFRFMLTRNPKVYYIMGGMSPRGTNHSIICHGGGFEWDPHPDGGFLVGPMDNGFYEITFLLPISMKGEQNG